MPTSNLATPDVGHQATAICGSCGRFTGPYERCPHCGARTTGRLRLRTLKLIAVGLAAVGLLALWWLARHTGVPAVSAADATGLMNLAYVRLNGRVARNLSYDPESGYLGFWLADATGEIHVTAYQEVTQDLLAAGKVPALGDEISVAGTLRVREDYTALTLNTAEHLTLYRPEAIVMEARAVTVLDEGQRVRLSGEVRRCTHPYPGLTLITLGDATGEIVIAVDETVTALTGPLPEIVEGQGIAVEGSVTLYRATPQVTPADVADIHLTARPAAAEATPLPSLRHITDHPLGTTVKAEGTIVLLEGLPGGVRAILDDGTAQVILLLWDAVYHALEAPETLDAGAEVAVEGEIQVYEGALEIVPRAPEGVTILTPAPAPPWVEVGAITARDAGRVVRVRGVLGRLEGFSAGVKIPLEDGTGTITILVWSNLYQALTPPPDAGQAVEVVGLVHRYHQELEIIPRSIYDWRVRAVEE